MSRILKFFGKMVIEWDRESRRLKIWWKGKPKPTPHKNQESILRDYVSTLEDSVKKVISQNPDVIDTSWDAYERRQKVAEERELLRAIGEAKRLQRRGFSSSAGSCGEEVHIPVTIEDEHVQEIPSTEP